MCVAKEERRQSIQEKVLLKYTVKSDSSVQDLPEEEIRSVQEGPRGDYDGAEECHC